MKGKGIMAIKDLVVGDVVLSDDKGTYSKYYSKNHFNKDTPKTFLRIFTESSPRPLEVTPDHMLYKHSSKLPVPAYSVKIGDILRTVNGPSKVTFVRKVSRNGFFNPLLMSGTIVVDGVVASNHVELSGFGGRDSGWFYLNGVKLIHWHSLTHFGLAPHRMICGKFITCTEDLDDDGLVPYTSYLLSLKEVSEEKQSALFTAAALIFLAAQCILFALMELLLKTPITCIVLGAAAGMWFFINKTKSSKVKVV